MQDNQSIYLDWVSIYSYGDDDGDRWKLWVITDGRQVTWGEDSGKCSPGGNPVSGETGKQTGTAEAVTVVSQI